MTTVNEAVAAVKSLRNQLKFLETVCKYIDEVDDLIKARNEYEKNTVRAREAFEIENEKVKKVSEELATLKSDMASVQNQSKNLVKESREQADKVKKDAVFAANGIVRNAEVQAKDMMGATTDRVEQLKQEVNSLLSQIKSLHAERDEIEQFVKELKNKYGMNNG